MTDRLRVGILGAGWAGASHAAAYSQVPGVEVSALWNRTRSKADDLAAKLAVPELQVYDDWQDLLSSNRCDVVSIATAPMFRSDALLMALAEGCHVLVEKPMSVGVQEALGMVEASEAAELVTACCLNWRYAPAYQAARRAVEAGDIGAIRDIRTEWYFRARSGFFEASPWIGRMDIANGSLGEGLSHDLDKARFLTGGEFNEIVSKITPVTIKPDDDFFIDGGRSMHFAQLTGGILAQFCLSVTAGEDQWRLTIMGDEGSLTIPDAGTTVVLQRYDDDEPLSLKLPAADRIPLTDLMQHTWNRLIEDFVDAIRDGDSARRCHPCLPTLTDGLRIEQVSAAARTSSDEHRWVQVAAEAAASTAPSA